MSEELPVPHLARSPGPGPPQGCLIWKEGRGWTPRATLDLVFSESLHVTELLSLSCLCLPRGQTLKLGGYAELPTAQPAPGWARAVDTEPPGSARPDGAPDRPPDLRCEFGEAEAGERPGTESVKAPGPERAEATVGARSGDGPRERSSSVAGKAWQAGIRRERGLRHGAPWRNRSKRTRTAAALWTEGLAGLRVADMSAEAGARAGD